MTLLAFLSWSSWKKAFTASYVDQQIAAAGAWNNIRGIHPLMRPLYPSFTTMVLKTSLIEPLVNLSQPQTPCTNSLKSRTHRKSQYNWVINILNLRTSSIYIHRSEASSKQESRRKKGHGTQVASNNIKTKNPDSVGTVDCYWFSRLRNWHFQRGDVEISIAQHYFKSTENKRYRKTKSRNLLKKLRYATGTLNIRLRGILKT